MTNTVQAAALPERGIVTVSGTERIKFLKGLTTNDIRQLAPDRALYTGFLTGQGKLLYDAFVIDDGDRVLIEITRSLADDFVKRLTGLKFRTKVEIGEPTPALAVAAIWGAQAATLIGLETIEGAVGNSPPTGCKCAFVDPRIAALGVRLVYPADRPIDAELERLGATRSSTSDYATFRLSLGVADTAEIAGEFCYALEANLEQLHGVDFRKGCYIGQELTARMKLKVGLRKRILPVHGAGDLPVVGTQVMAGTTKLGPLIATNGARGLALLRLDHLAEANQDAIRADDIGLTVDWPSWLPRAS
jgi:tRNA-modifying protein YgfZ